MVRPRIFRAAFAIAIMAGVAIETGHLPVDLLLRGEFGRGLLDFCQREAQGALLEIVQVEARGAGGLFFGEAALVTGENGHLFCSPGFSRHLGAA